MISHQSLTLIKGASDDDLWDMSKVNTYCSYSSRETKTIRNKIL